MNIPDSKEPQEWLEKAQHDLIAAQTLLEHGGHADTIVVHCHQAAEKALKAALLGMGVDYPFTHDLLLLLQSCIEKDVSFGALKDMGMRLSPLYEKERYPFMGTEESYTSRELRKFVRMAQEVVEFVQEKINSVDDFFKILI